MNTEKKLEIWYLCIMVVEIPMGLMMLIVPDLFIDLLGFPKPQDPLIFGVCASVWLAFGVLSILGFREPMKYVPVLLFQFTYKVIWFIGVVLPWVLTSTIQMYGILMIAMFAAFVAADIIVIPWKTFFERERTQSS